MKRLMLEPHRQRMLTQLVSGLPVLDPILGPWVAGASVRSVVLDTNLDDVHDVDVFYRTRPQMEATQERFKELGYTRLDKERPGKASLRYMGHWKKEINLINFRMFNSAEELLLDFGCTASQFLTDGHQVWCGDDSVGDARNKVFRLVDTTNFLTVKYVKKYLGTYGYRVEGVDPWKLIAERGELGEY